MSRNFKSQYSSRGNGGSFQGSGGNGGAGKQMAETIQRALDALPYDFLPVHAGAAVEDDWVRHDGSADGLSGELLCELETLTPLLVANEHYPVGQAVSEIQNAAVALCGPKVLEEKNEDKKKKILEPLRLPDGRVVIPGTGLKGMIRASLSALLNAPMERVEERTFSYRPNLSFAKNHPRLAMRAAVVEAVNADGLPTVIKVLPANATVHFGKGPPPPEEWYGKEETTGFRLSFWEDPRGRAPRKYYIRFDNSVAPSEPLNSPAMIFLRYSNGIDGKVRLGAMHAQKNDKPKPKCHYFAAVRKSDYANAEVKAMDETALQHFRETMDHLGDKNYGHLRKEHPLSGQGGFDRLPRAISRCKKFLPNQLIYVEVELDRNQAAKSVVSFGHHFHYRWRYRNSIRKAWASAGETLRAELQTTAGEKQGGTVSAARLFFGYVKGDVKTGRLELGKDLPEKLAGRIACNMAVEVTANPKDETRFLGESENQYLIPLKILGQPRASAVEFYLQQDFPKPDRKDASPLRTYGDLIVKGSGGTPREDDPAGKLRGRKVYRHFEPAEESYLEQSAEIREDAQSVLARFVSPPGTPFRFTVRFQDLRPWELGALLAVLEPRRLAEALKEPINGEFAHKLGYARPLGWGSVRLKMDRCRVWRDDDFTPLPEPGESKEAGFAGAIENLLARDDFQRLPKQGVRRWLDRHRFQDKGTYCYPTARDKEGQKIFAWHTAIRRDHSKLRRTTGRR